jgi:hypothetical protein
MKRRTLTKISPHNGPYLTTTIQGDEEPLRTHLVTCRSDGRDHEILFHLNDRKIVTPSESALEEIHTVLQKLVGESVIDSFEKGRYALYTLKFRLLSGKGFCESGLETCHKVFTALGVADLTSRRYLYQILIVDQEVQCWLKGQWIPYNDYLRETMPLFKVKRDAPADA